MPQIVISKNFMKISTKFLLSFEVFCAGNVKVLGYQAILSRWGTSKVA